MLGWIQISEWSATRQRKNKPEGTCTVVLHFCLDIYVLRKLPSRKKCDAIEELKNTEVENTKAEEGATSWSVGMFLK